MDLGHELGLDRSTDPAFSMMSEYLRTSSLDEARAFLRSNRQLRDPEAVRILDRFILNSAGRPIEQPLRLRRQWLATVPAETVSVIVMPPDVIHADGYAVAKSLPGRPFAGFARDGGFTAGQVTVTELRDGAYIFRSGHDAVLWAEAQGWTVMNRSTFLP